LIVYLTHHYYTNIFNENIQFCNFFFFNNERNPLLAQIEVRADIFSGSLAISASQSQKNDFNFLSSKFFL